jgi:hypothetical protein
MPLFVGQIRSFTVSFEITSQRRRCFTRYSWAGLCKHRCKQWFVEFSGRLAYPDNGLIPALQESRSRYYTGEAILSAKDSQSETQVRQNEFAASRNRF